MTAIIQPMKNSEDQLLSLAGQTILLFSYFCCAIVRVANSPSVSNTQRQEILGFSDAKGVFLAMGMCFIAYLGLVFSCYIYRINELIAQRIAKAGASSSEIA